MEHCCPMCHGEAGLLGVLGSVAHLRCRDCGWQYSIDAEDIEPSDNEFDIDPGSVDS